MYSLSQCILLCCIGVVDARRYLSLSLTFVHFHSLSFTIIHFHSLSLTVTPYHSLSFTITHCHSLSLTVIYYHSLSFTITHLHSLSFLIRDESDGGLGPYLLCLVIIFMRHFIHYKYEWHFH